MAEMTIYRFGGVPAGWYVEGPDESVGIFGSYICHDACPTWDEDDNEAIVAEGVGRHFGEGMRRIVVWHERWTCPCCGQSVMLARAEQDPDDIDDPYYWNAA